MLKTWDDHIEFYCLQHLNPFEAEVWLPIILTIHICIFFFIIKMATVPTNKAPPFSTGRLASIILT